jgi:hypothetical protein
VVEVGRVQREGVGRERAGCSRLQKPSGESKRQSSETKQPESMLSNAVTLV